MRGKIRCTLSSIALSLNSCSTLPFCKTRAIKLGKWNNETTSFNLRTSNRAAETNFSWNFSSLVWKQIASNFVKVFPVLWTYYMYICIEGPGISWKVAVDGERQWILRVSKKWLTNFFESKQAKKNKENIWAVRVCWCMPCVIREQKNNSVRNIV